MSSLRSSRWRNRCLMCNKVEYGEKVQCFGFPANSELKRKWAEFCRKFVSEIRNHDRLCSRHFTDNDYNIKQNGQNSSKLSLKPNAVPSVHTEPKRYKISCILCGYQGLDVDFFHHFPTDLHVKKQWLQICDLEEIDISKPYACRQLYVCGSHFLSTDYETDGHLRKLKANAVPTLLLGPLGTFAISDAEEPAKTSFLSCTKISSLDGNRVISSQTSTISSSLEEIRRPVSSLDPSSVMDIDSSQSNCHSNSHDNSTLVEEDITEENRCEIISTDHDSSTSSTNINYSTPTHSRSKLRYPGDFNSPDINTPRKARKFLYIAKKTIADQTKKIRAQSQKIRRLESRMKTLKDVVLDLEKKSLIPDTAAATLMTFLFLNKTRKDKSDTSILQKFNFGANILFEVLNWLSFTDMIQKAISKLPPERISQLFPIIPEMTEPVFSN